MVYDVPVLRPGQIAVREDLEAARYRALELMELLRGFRKRVLIRGQLQCRRNCPAHVQRGKPYEIYRD